MFRILILMLFCLGGFTAMCQDETAMLTAEKSSEWIKVEMPRATEPARRPASVRKNTAQPRSQNTEGKPVIANPPKDDFDKTNNKVKRFKKG